MWIYNLEILADAKYEQCAIKFLVKLGKTREQRTSNCHLENAKKQHIVKKKNHHAFQDGYQINSDGK